MNYLPLLGLLGGIAVAIALGVSGQIVAGVGCAVLGLGLGLFIRTQFAYPKKHFPEGQVAPLVGEIKVSKIRSVPVTLRGKIIGRGIPGLYWSEDLVLQDDTGFMVMDYRQPLGILESLFGLFRAESFIGQQVTARGWYRRFPRPYLELWQVELPDGAVHTCHNWGLIFYGSLLLTMIGLLVALGGLIVAA